MKPARLPVCLLLLGLPVRMSAQATVSPETIEGTVAVAGGTAWLTGNRAAYEYHEQHRTSGWGGLETFRYRRETKGSTFSLNGHALFADGDYAATARWQNRQDVFARAGFRRTRFFHNGTGAWFPGNGAFLPQYAPYLHLDRSSFWVEAGRAPERGTYFHLRYERQTRDGRKPSTQLGETNLTGGFGSRAIVPAFLEFDETRDLATAEVGRSGREAHWQAGVRYDRTRVKQRRVAARRPGEAQARVTTSRENTAGDLYSAHTFGEKLLREDLRASAGAMVTSLDTNLSGSRIFGPEVDAVFDPALPSRQNGDAGLLALGGGEQMKQYVGNLNLMYQPSRHWTLKPTVRYEHLHLDNLANYVATVVLPSLSTSLQNLATQSVRHEDRLVETLEARYTGLRSWTFTARADATQTSGDLLEQTVDTATSLNTLDRKSEYTRHAQKYSLNGTWYVKLGVTFDAEYYYKLRANDYKHPRDSTAPGSLDRYGGFIRDHDFATHDCNVRLSWRLGSKLSLVSRYDYQRSRIQTATTDTVRWETGKTTTHIVSQSATWMPHPRFYLSGTGNLTYDQLSTPNIGLVRNDDNNYLSAALSGGYVLSKVDDLLFDLSHYQADGYKDVSALTQPYGADQRMQTWSLTWIRRQTETLTYTVKYSYATNRDRLSGGRNDYRAHILYSKIQYTF